MFVWLFFLAGEDDNDNIAPEKQRVIIIIIFISVGKG